jgi:hypothetical protein
MSTIGRTKEPQNPKASSSTKLAAMMRERFRGFHQGQRSSIPHQQAGHMTAPDPIIPPRIFFLASQGPSTHDDFMWMNRTLG